MPNEKKVKKNIVLLTMKGESTKANNFEQFVQKDADFATYAVTCQQLRCFPFQRFIDRIFPNDTKIRERIMRTKYRFHSHKTDFTYGGTFGIPEKSLENLFYRFHPVAIVVADPYTLRNVAHFIKKKERECKIFVVCNDYFSQDDLKVADYYFIKGEEQRKTFLSYGISADSLFCYVPSAEEKAVFSERENAKKKLNLSEHEKLVLFDVSEVHEKQEELFEFLQKNSFPDVYCFCCGNNADMKKLLDENLLYEVLPEEKELYFCASDVLFTVADEKQIEEAKKKKKEIIVFHTSGLAQSYRNLESDNTLLKVETEKDITRAMEFFLHRDKWQRGFETVISGAFHRVFLNDNGENNLS